MCIVQADKNMRKNILIVDDDILLLDSLSNLLRLYEFNVFTADSGADAMNILAQESIDLIISDECMPGLKGHELLSYVSEKYPSLIKVLLTGNACKEVLMNAINETGGVFKLLEKPCPPDKLVAILREAFGGKGTDETAIAPDSALFIVDVDNDGGIFLRDPGGRLDDFLNS